MVIIQVSGGLGNQLRAFAVYVKFQLLGVEAKLDISLYDSTNEYRGGGLIDRALELNYLKVSYEVSSSEENRRYRNPSLIQQVRNYRRYGRRILCYVFPTYDLSVFDIREGYISGDFSQEGYTQDIEAALRERICFPLKEDMHNREILNRIHETESVSIHIRRGDYMDQNHYAALGSVASEEYYNKAIAYMKEQLKDKAEQVVFFVFSDDKEYIQRTYSGMEQMEMVDWNKNEDSYYDMYLMSQCRHNITAYSSFSFWASRLNANPDKIVVRVVPDKVEEGITGNCTFINTKGEIVQERVS